MISENYTYTKHEVLDELLGEFDYWIVYDKQGNYFCETKTEDNAALIVEVLNCG